MLRLPLFPAPSVPIHVRTALIESDCAPSLTNGAFRSCSEERSYGSIDRDLEFLFFKVRWGCKVLLCFLIDSLSDFLFIHIRIIPSQKVGLRPCREENS